MTTVIKLGGRVCGNPAAIDELAAAWQEQRGDWVLIHGGGPQLDAALAATGRASVKIDGLRVTSDEDMVVVQKVMDEVGAELTRELKARGVAASHVPSGRRAVRADVRPGPGGIALGRVGTPTRCRLPAKHGVQVVTPVGWDADGPLNINADVAAAAIAVALDAACLVLVTDTTHVFGKGGEPIAILHPGQAEELIAHAVVQAGMIAKLRSALEALDAGVGEVRIGGMDAAWGGPGTRVVRGPAAVAI